MNRKRFRGFESLSLRQHKKTPYQGVFLCFQRKDSNPRRGNRVATAALMADEGSTQGLCSNTARASVIYSHEDRADVTNGVRSRIPLSPPRKKTSVGCLFSVIFALRQVKSLDCFASYELTSSMFILVVKYIITETEGFIITFTK